MMVKDEANMTACIEIVRLVTRVALSLRKSRFQSDNEIATINTYTENLVIFGLRLDPGDNKHAI